MHESELWRQVGSLLAPVDASQQAWLRRVFSVGASLSSTNVLRVGAAREHLFGTVSGSSARSASADKLYVSPAAGTAAACAPPQSASSSAPVSQPQRQERAPVLEAPPAPALAKNHEQLVELLSRGEAAMLGLERSQLERYLSSAEFERVFGVSRAQFAALAKWRQDALKKRAGLF